MKFSRSTTGAVAGAVLAALALVSDTPAQPRGPKGPVVVSPEVGTDRKVTFRIHAPKAESVGVFTTDIPGGFQPRPMKKGENGVWQTTLGPIDPGTYRYLLSVDGVMTADPRNQAVSESNGNAWSVVHVPGSDFMDTSDVPHGAVARINYRSSTLGRTHLYLHEVVAVYNDCM
jgi:enterochelin esterase family protein